MAGPRQNPFWLVTQMEQARQHCDFVADVTLRFPNFGQLIAERRKAPRDDMLSISLTWTIDGEPLSDNDLLEFCLLMFTAGLDTVAAQLSMYPAWHERIPDYRSRPGRPRPRARWAGRPGQPPARVGPALYGGGRRRSHHQAMNMQPSPGRTLA